MHFIVNRNNVNDYMLTNADAYVHIRQFFIKDL